LNITALILLFTYIFIYPLYSHTSTQPQTSYNDHFLRTPIVGDEIIVPAPVNCSKVVSMEHETIVPNKLDHQQKHELEQGLENESLMSLTENELLVEKIFLEHLHQTQSRFRNHPGHKFNQEHPDGASLEEYMLHLSQRSSCHMKPIFLTMARVSSELYWQLIENYFYTMSVF
jgi:hypothetical protein